MKYIHTNEAPAAIGPYSQGIIVNNLFFSSGQIPLTAEGEMVTGDVKEQTHQVFKNLKAVLKEAVLPWKQLLKRQFSLKAWKTLATLMKYMVNIFQLISQHVFV